MWLTALILAVLWVLLLLVRASGNLAASSLLIPTALVANLIVIGGPQESGRPVLWIITFMCVTVMTWDSSMVRVTRSRSLASKECRDRNKAAPTYEVTHHRLGILCLSPLGGESCDELLALTLIWKSHGNPLQHSVDHLLQTHGFAFHLICRDVHETVEPW